MRIRRDYPAIIKKSLEWLFSRFRPFTVHTEAIMVDSVWEKIKKEVNKGRVAKWYVMTPTNINYFKSEFNIKMSKKRISEILKKRYQWMLNHGQKLELHIHLSHTIDNMTYQEQEKLFKEAIEWMKKELDIKPIEFVPGWWIYNKDTIKLCEKYKLKMIHERDYDYTHDYIFK